MGVAIISSREPAASSVSVSPSNSSVMSVISSVSSNKKRSNESQGMGDIFKQVINLCADHQNSKLKSDSGGSIY